MSSLPRAVPVWRALLFMPGDDRRKIEKAAVLDVDAVIMDLEDGVALSRKDAARTSVAEALRSLDFGRASRLVRINPVGSAFWRDDLEAVLPARPDGIVLPKAEDGAHIRDVSGLMSEGERSDGLPAKHIMLLPIIETAQGVVLLREIASADTRLAALIFGAEDLVGDIGATRTRDGEEVQYARSAVVLHAKAQRLSAIDTPFVHLSDDEGLRLETERGLRMGYTGKLAIHPHQVEIIQQVYTPDLETIERAHSLVQAYAAHQALGSGVFVVDGKMIDMPMIRSAQAVLERARAAGIAL